MDDLVLKMQCMQMAADCFKVGAEKYNAQDIVLWATYFYDFCKGNKPAAETVPPA